MGQDRVQGGTGDVNESFLMAVDDTFSVPGRGVVATGRVRRGTVSVGDSVDVLGPRGGQAVVVGLDRDFSPADRVHAGDNVGLLIRATDGPALARDQVLVAPGSLSARTGFVTETTLGTDDLATEARAPSTAVGVDRLRIRIEETGRVAWGNFHDPQGPDRASERRATLDVPTALEVGFHFAIVGPGRRRGHGRITRVLP